MIYPDAKPNISIDDLKRRYNFMCQLEEFSFENSLGRNTSLAGILGYEFKKLPLYHRLKENIRFSVVFDLKCIEDYLKFVVFNHCECPKLQPVDYELVVYFNTQLLVYLHKVQPSDTLKMLEKLHQRLAPVFWFDKSVKFWINPEYCEAGNNHPMFKLELFKEFQEKESVSLT